MLIQAILLLSSTLPTKSFTTSFCDLNCPRDRNTLCAREPCPFIFRNCRHEPYGCMLSDEEADTIVRIHNEIRQKVASGQGGLGNAANMKVLTYDRELEMMAQCMANTCAMRHDLCRSSPHHNTIGQNIYGQYHDPPQNMGKELTFAVKYWYTEGKGFKKDLVKSYVENEAYNHFTQVIWANTSYIGCGRTIFGDGKALVMYCNYAPAGNVHGTPIFIEGQGCSKCDGGAPCNSEYKALCGTVTKTKNLDQYVPMKIGWREYCRGKTLNGSCGFEVVDPLLFLGFLSVLFV